MAKLHEVLAVETNLENQANKVRTELQATFEKKRHLFEEKRIIFTPNGENEPPVVEQQSDIQTNVRKELDWITPHLAKALDASFQVARANTEAKATVVVEDGEILVDLLTDIPATALLELEKRVAELQQLAQSIPTLDPAKGFQLDTQRNIYKAREVRKSRTKKQPRVLIRYEATKEHPAQTEIVTEDVPIGSISEQEWSGLITPVEKAEIINRAEILARAVRAARSRANETVVDTSAKIGSKIIKYVFG